MEEMAMSHTTIEHTTPLLVDPADLLTDFTIDIWYMHNRFIEVFWGPYWKEIHQLGSNRIKSDLKGEIESI